MRQSALTFLLVVLFSILGVTGKAQGETQPKESEPQGIQTYANQEAAECHPVDVRPLNVESASNTPTPTQQAPDQKPNASKPVDSVWWFNALLVFFTLCLVVVGVMQFCVYREQARSMRQGNEFTKTTLLLTQRPRIRVRSYITGPPRAPFFTISLEIANYGGTDAIIVGCEMTTFLYPAKIDIDLILSAAVFPIHTEDILAPESILKAGESKRHVAPPYTIPDGHDAAFAWGELTLYIRCYVAYRRQGEDMKGCYQTLCLRYLKTHEARTFTKVDDPNYEYED